MPRRSRHKRTNSCAVCRTGVPQGDQAQAVNFYYLCTGCHDQGYRLESNTQPDDRGILRRRTRVLPPPPGQDHGPRPD